MSWDLEMQNYGKKQMLYINAIFQMNLTVACMATRWQGIFLLIYLSTDQNTDSFKHIDLLPKQPLRTARQGEDFLHTFVFFDFYILRHVISTMILILNFF